MAVERFSFSQRERHWPKKICTPEYDAYKNYETRGSLYKVLKYSCGDSGPVLSLLLINFTEINSTWNSNSKANMRS